MDFNFGSGGMIKYTYHEIINIFHPPDLVIPSSFKISDCKRSLSVMLQVSEQHCFLKTGLFLHQSQVFNLLDYSLIEDFILYS